MSSQARQKPVLLMVTGEFPPFKGGAGRYAAQVSSAFSRCGLKVAVLAPPASDPTVYLGTESGSRMQVYDEFDAADPFAAGRCLYRHMVRCSHVMLADARAVRIFRYFPRPWRPYSILVHGTEVWELLDPARASIPEVQRRRVRRLYQCAERLICNSSPTRKLLHEAGVGTDHAQVVHPIFIEPPSVCPAISADDLRRRYGLRPGELVLFSASRLVDDKGFDVLLRAVHQVSAEREGIRLVIAGDGPHRDHLVSLRDALRLDDVVLFAGAVPDSELGAHFELGDVFVLPTRSRRRFEGFGLVFIEAAVRGRPVIAGGEGGVPEAVIDGETGILIDPDDVDAVAAAIMRLCDNPGMRAQMGASAKRRVEDRFTFREMIRQIQPAAFLSVGASRLDLRLLWQLKLARWNIGQRRESSLAAL